MPKIIIDAVEYEVAAGQNLIEAAASVGIQIPHYCYHPGLSVSGNCRMCLVEVKGPRGVMPQIACNTPVSEGLEVLTTTETVKKMRKGVMEFLLLNHPIDCPICDQAGECGLQDYYMEYGLYTNRSTVPKVKKNKVVDIGPLVVLDQERCILCSRCVRFCQEITHTNELVITGRGENCRIDIFPGKKLDNPYSANVVDICPVGALTSKDFRFKKRVWFLNTTRSICTGCARGCNIYLDHEKGQVYRYRPRPNPAVNAWWICDEGRLSYKQIHHNRLQQALIHGEEHVSAVVLTSIQESLSHVLQQHGTEAVAGLASSQASLEDNFALQYFLKQLGISQIWGPSFGLQGEGDAFLRHPDKSPNTEGLRLLGIETEAEGFLTALRAGKVKWLLILNNPCEDPALDQILQEQKPTLIYLGTHRNGVASKADYVLPITTHAEHYASYVNCEQRLQKVYRAFPPGPEVLPAWQVLSQIFSAQTHTKPWDDIETVWKHLSQTHPALHALSFYTIPDEGLSLTSIPSEKAVVTSQ